MAFRQFQRLFVYVLCFFDFLVLSWVFVFCSFTKHWQYSVCSSLSQQWAFYRQWSAKSKTNLRVNVSSSHASKLLASTAQFLDCFLDRYEAAFADGTLLRRNQILGIQGWGCWTVARARTLHDDAHDCAICCLFFLVHPLTAGPRSEQVGFCERFVNVHFLKLISNRKAPD